MTSEQQPRILLVEDSQDLALLYQVYLRDENYQLSHVTTGAEALAQLRGPTPPDVALLDLDLPDINGMQILELMQKEHLPTAAIIVTAHGSAKIEAKASQFAALDFIEKPFTAKRLLVTLRNAVQHQHLSRLVDFYKESERSEYHGFIGASLPMQAVYRIIDSVASSKATVFITGESGTGKELCAQAIHVQSPRREQPFVTLNCAAIPKELMESEIFGHVKGAFTGALNERRGAAAQADGGTLFLDEIGDMDLELQSKLLRFVQTGSFQKVGSSKTETVDVRFICATHRDPLAEVRAGRFREDLYYRLHVLPIALPPLRQRDQDILLIANNFLRKYAAEEHKSFNRFHAEVEHIFLGYAWPGNVRELQNVVRNVVVFHQGRSVLPSMLPSPLDHIDPQSMTGAVIAPTPLPAPISPIPADAEDQIRPLWQIEKQTIESAIHLCDGNITKAAKCLEINPSTIYRKLQQWKQEGRAGDA